MDFMVQFRTKPDKMPIENTLIPWKEKDSFFRKVATVTVPPQAIDTPLHRELDENLTFNPFHCLPEHRPLGGYQPGSPRRDEGFVGLPSGEE